MPSYSLTQFSSDVVQPENAAGVVSICRKLQMDVALANWSAGIEAKLQKGEALPARYGRLRLACSPRTIWRSAYGSEVRRQWWPRRYHR